MSLPLVQEHGAGCAVACAAYILDVSYQEALKLFDKPVHAIDQGFLCEEVVVALRKGGLSYLYEEVSPFNQYLLDQPFTIVFLAISKKYPLGHFVVRTEHNCWMNSWINYPCIASAQAGFEKELFGKAEWVIYSRKDKKSQP